MKSLLGLLSCFLLLGNFVDAQELSFKNGVYLSSKAVRTNQPEYSLEEVKIKEKSNDTNTSYAKRNPIIGNSKLYNQSVVVKSITKTNEEGKKEKIDLRKVLAIAVDNKIYFQINKVFTPSFKVGAICHITQEMLKETNNWGESMIGGITADGAQIGSGKNKKYKAPQYLYKIGEEEVVPFTLENLKNFLSDDPKLLEHFLANEDRKTQSYQYVLKYNERNKVNRGK